MHYNTPKPDQSFMQPKPPTNSSSSQQIKFTTNFSSSQQIKPTYKPFRSPLYHPHHLDPLYQPTKTPPCTPYTISKRQDQKKNAFNLNKHSTKQTKSPIANSTPDLVKSRYRCLPFIITSERIQYVASDPSYKNLSFIHTPRKIQDPEYEDGAFSICNATLYPEEAEI